MSDRTLRLGVAIVALAGAAVAGYLTWVHYQPEALVCTGGGGCEAVQDSEYAVVAGVPVALLGLLAYTTVLVLTAIDVPAARVMTAAIALAAVAFSVYLIALQAFVIDAWCIWCLVNDVVVAPTLATLSVLRLRTTGSGFSQTPPCITSSAPGGEPSA